MADILIIAAIIIAVVTAFLVMQKNKGGCGNCSNCQNCKKKKK